MVIKLYNADTLEYSGTIISNGPEWSFKEVENAQLTAMTKGMPLKALLANLIVFNLVYDVHEN